MSEQKYEPRLRKQYRDEIAPSMMKEFGYGNVMQVPRLSKVVVNMGLGEAVGNPNIIKSAIVDLETIAGQKPVICKAKKSISNFKLRQGQAIGVMVTLRKNHMWEFFDRLVNIAMPRIRDFKGISGKAFDGHGNYSLGLREQIIFPEINYDKVDKVKGMNISIITTAKTDPEAKSLLKSLGLPLRN
ncbi:MAG: 50S ribosomal protein L5 [Myxococcota bacterium]